MESSAVLWLKLAGSEGFMDIAGAGGALVRMLYSYLRCWRAWASGTGGEVSPNHVGVASEPVREKRPFGDLGNRDGVPLLLIAAR